MAQRIGHFSELDVYRAARHLQGSVFHISKSFPAEERYSLTDQIRRSSRSVGANIAEAWQKRRYEASFVNKLTDADGELAETEHWVLTACECEYITSVAEQDLIRQARDVGRLLGGMIRHSDRWCASQSQGR
jgi:four helix bundle protein